MTKNGNETNPSGLDDTTEQARLAAMRLDDTAAWSDPDNNPQAIWERTVRAEITRLGADPDEIEDELEGFGEDWASEAHDPIGYARSVVDDHNNPEE